MVQGLKGLRVQCLGVGVEIGAQSLRGEGLAWGGRA